MADWAHRIARVNAGAGYIILDPGIAVVVPSARLGFEMIVTVIGVREEIEGL